MQNGFVESFNGCLRGECLNRPLFFSLHHARHLIAVWRDTNDNHRPNARIDDAHKARASPTIASGPINPDDKSEGTARQLIISVD